MKRSIGITGLTLLLTLFAKSYAQYAFSTFPPPTVFSLEDLWHFSLSGPTGGTHDQFYVVLQVYDGNQQLIIHSTCSPFAIGTGNFYVNKLNTTSIQPINTQFTGGGTLNSLVGNGGLFPAGVYYIQYTLMGRNTATQSFEQLDQQQISQTVDLLYPPTLLTPFDNDSIEEYYPVFTWAPAFSAGSERIFYEIAVAEELPGQSAEQAINSNPYYFHQENLTASSIQYPVSARKLQSNQWYAWRVTAYVNGQPMARSETWRFIIVESKPDSCKPKPAEFFYEMRNTTGPNLAVITDGQLNFMFTERYEVNFDELKFRIVNTEGKVVADYRSVSRPVSGGYNQYMMLICGDELNIPLGTYILEVLGMKGEKWVLPFKNETTINPCNPNER